MQEIRMLKRGRDYRETYDGFRWEIPRRYNIGVDVCDRHAGNASRPALIHHDEGTGAVVEYSFRQLRELSNRLANAFTGLGIGRGDRVGIVLPQRPETAVAHLTVYKMGAVAVPLSCLFGPEALEYRLRHSGASLVVVDDDGLPKVESIESRLPSLRHVVAVSSRRCGDVHSFDDLLARGDEQFTPAATDADDPALLIYTSGTTGPPKGALHAHRALLGHLPGVEFSNNFPPQAGDRFWGPADWAWIAGLMDVLLSAWHHGLPVLVDPPGKFDPERAFYLMARHNVRNALIPPSALKMMREIREPRQRHDFDLRTVFSGGEPLGAEVLEWGEESLGVTINEVYGQTEVNMVVGSCHEVMRIRPGSMGRPMPGHEVAVIREDGSRAPAGETGEIAVRRPDPVMLLEYWNDPQATEDKFIGDWARTGDMARVDDEGYFWFMGREDDLIISSGYRIGPSEVEDSILRHPGVSMAAVVGVPHEVRGEVVKAYVKLKSGVRASAELAEAIRETVRVNLGAHEYPREIEFVDSLPMTTTGKVIRRELRERGEAPR